MAHMREVARQNGKAWEVRWVDSGRERQRTFTVKRDAERYALTVENAKANGAPTAELAGRTEKFDAVVKASLDASRPRLKAGTVLQYENLYATRILPTFGAQRVSAITSQEVQKWVSGLVAAGKAPNTVHNHYVALNKVFRYAVRHRLISHNPCDAVELPKNVHTEGFAPVFLTKAQVDLLADALDSVEPYGLLVRFCALTGLRAAEVQGLRIRDVVLDASGAHVEVRQSIKRIGGVWTVGTPKSNRSNRDVPLLDRSLIADLKLYRLQHPHSGDPDALFWPARSNGSRRLDYSRNIDCGSVLQYYMRPLLPELGLPPKMRWHDLRHTYASLMLAAGIPPYKLSRWMGHASLVTTDTVYSHLYPSDYSEEIAQFEAFTSGDNEPSRAKTIGER
jgi:integrase